MSRPYGLLCVAVVAAMSVTMAAADCLADSTKNAFFEDLNGGVSIPVEDSCCQLDVCGLPCPEEVGDPGVGFGVAVGLCIALSFLVGIATYFVVNGEAENYFVAGHSLPLWIVAMTLGAQSVDSNALLGNVDLSYKFHFYDGAVIPIGLALSLFLNALFLARHINKETALTLPDVLARRYGKLVEVLISITTITSFLMLLAGNLVGMGVITAYVWDIDQTAAVWTAAAIVWAYTVSGGLFSVAYTDVLQGFIGWSGCIVCAYWFIVNADESAPPPSVGFPNYTYPDDNICSLYDGETCFFNQENCCFNVSKWCFNDDPSNCTNLDNGAYPIGDQSVFSDQMGNPTALTPFPNAVFWNWCTIFILGFGNLGALDFQVRCMAAKTPSTATIGCILAGCFTLFIGIPFSYLGAITRFYYGPDSVRAEFDADTCSTILGLPTCGAWLPDENAFVKLLTNEAPPVIGAWCLIGIVAASLSTADGAILAMGTVFSHNLMRQFDVKWPDLITADNLLLMARISTIPFTFASTMIAAYYKDSGSAAGATGYLLIVAFDIVLATVVAPLFGCFYAKNPSPRAALCSVLVGAITRVVLEFALPKDGQLLLPFNEPEFYNYGPAASVNYPTFFDGENGTVWNPDDEPCEQEQFEDYTGADSLAAFVGAILTFVLIQVWEDCHGGSALFTLPGMVPYEKQFAKEDSPGEEVDEVTKEKVVEGVPMKEEEQSTSDDPPEQNPEEVEVDDDTPPEE